MQILQSLPKFVVLIFSIVFHEVAHGYIALKRGDTTARDAGRLTLNPLPHIDLFGTILFPLFLLITRSPFLFGWAKPVPVNPFRMNQSRKDMAYVGAAGPISNLILAVVAGLILRNLGSSSSIPPVIIDMLFYMVLINLVLAFFNLVPIPPLDGSRIVMAVLPEDLAIQYIKLERFGMILVFLFVFLGLFRVVVYPFVRLFLMLILGSSPF